MKNLLTVPVSLPRLLGAKLIVTAILAFLFGLYSVGVTVPTGVIAGLPGLTIGTVLGCGLQLVWAVLTTYLVCMPMILIFGQIRGAYLGGAILTFFLGYSMLFFKSGVLLSAYPFSAALILAGFDMEEYNGATTQPSLLLAAAGMVFVILVTALILKMSRPGKQRKPGVKKRAGRRR